ncbi:hypothetical protein BH11PLA1_BH11PLA1_21140 [soil metagenome]
MRFNTALGAAALLQPFTAFSWENPKSSPHDHFCAQYRGHLRNFMAAVTKR